MLHGFKDTLTQQFLSDSEPSGGIPVATNDTDRAFLGWANLQLIERGLEVQSNQNFYDGVCMLALLESLTATDYNITSQSRIARWKLILEIIESERIHLPKCLGKSKTVEQADALISELLWCFILHFELSEMVSDISVRKSIDLQKAAKGLTQWLNDKLPDDQITDFSTCWLDGTSLCALVNSISPNRVPSSYRNDSMTSEMRVRLATQAAEDHLGIPQLVSTQAITSGDVNEKAMITYIALFRSAERILERGLVPVTPLPSTAIATTTETVSVGGSRGLVSSPNRASRCIAYGAGLRYGEVGRRSEFIVQLGNGTRSELSVAIECKPYNQQQTPYKPNLKIKQTAENTYTVQYTPVRSGDYTVSIYYAGAHIHSSPFKLSAGEHALKPSNSLEDICCSLESSLNGISPRPIQATFSRDSGIQSSANASASSSWSGDDSKSGMSTPSLTSAGTFEPYLALDGGDTALGSGLICGEVGILGSFLVYTPRDNKGPLSVCITCPAMSIPIPNVRTVKEASCYVHRVSYLPTEAGVYEIEIKWGSELIKGSPYWLAVVETSQRGDCFLTDNSTRKLPIHLPIGGKNAVVYYSATTLDDDSRKTRVLLESLLKKELPDVLVSPIPIDVSLSKQQREEIFTLAGSKSLPMLFIDGKFVGDYGEIVGYHRRGELVKHLRKTVWDARGDVVSQSSHTFGRQTLERVNWENSDHAEMYASSHGLDVEDQAMDVRDERLNVSDNDMKINERDSNQKLTSKTTSIVINNINKSDNNNNVIKMNGSTTKTSMYRLQQKSQVYRITTN